MIWRIPALAQLVLPALAAPPVVQSYEGNVTVPTYEPSSR